MKETPDASKGNEKGARNFMGWMLLPISLFPFAALITYDWHSIEQLSIPAAHTSNWIGPIGDIFAYYGYSILGLAIWIIPVYCIIIGCRSVAGEPLKPGIRALWRTSLIISAACLLEIIAPNAPGIEAAQKSVNIMNPGGIIGYVISTKFLIPLFDYIGAGVLMLIVLIISLGGAIGYKNILSFLGSIFNWIVGPSFSNAVNNSANAASHAASAADNQMGILEKIKIARENAKEAKQKEKEMIQKEKEKIKQDRADREKKLKDLMATNAADAAKDRKSKLLTVKPSTKATEKTAAPTISNNTETQADQTDKDISQYILPDVSLLEPLQKSTADHGNVEMMGKKLVDTLQLFGIDSTLSYTIPGPVVTKYALMLAPGTNYRVIKTIEKNLMGALHAKSLRIETPIPGEECVGVEVPNTKPASVSFREVFESDDWKVNKFELPLLFGKDAAGNNLIGDLAEMPHMLVAGATGQGKSVCLNSLITALLMSRTPEQLKFIMVDPKSVEFTPYSNIPHLLTPIITENRKVLYSLRWAVSQMEKRLQMFSKLRVKNIYEFNHRKILTQCDLYSKENEITSEYPRTIPYIVIIIDEVADLMAACAREVTPEIGRLAAKARAAGIHLILATQRPDTKTINGTIKANVPGRVAFKTAQAIDSRTILDAAGAENLIGRGDMLYKDKNSNLIRAQGAWISNNEILNIVSFIEEHCSPQYDDKFTSNLARVKEATNDDPFASLDDEESNSSSAPEKVTQREMIRATTEANDEKKAIEVLLNTKRASVSNLQRHLKWGYNHAAHIIDALAEKGIVTKQDPGKNGPRSILLTDDELLKILNGEDSISRDENEPDTVEENSTLENDDITQSDDTPFDDEFMEEQI